MQSAARAGGHRELRRRSPRAGQRAQERQASVDRRAKARVDLGGSKTACSLPSGSFSARVMSLGRCSEFFLCDGEPGRKGNERGRMRGGVFLRFFLSLKDFEGLSATVCNQTASSCKSEAA